MRKSPLCRRTERAARSVRTTSIVLPCGILLIFLLSVAVPPVAADTSDQSTIAGGFSSTITQCVIDCAANAPPEEYAACVANCYARAMMADDGGLPKWMLLSVLVKSDTDLALLSEAAAEIADLQHMLASSSKDSEVLDLLADTFTTTYWDDDEFVRMLVDAYFVAAMSDLITYSQTRSPRRAIAAHDMMMEFCLDTQLLDRVSTLGKVGCMAMASRLAGAADRAYVDHAIQAAGLAAEVAEFNSRVEFRDKNSPVDGRVR